MDRRPDSSEPRVERETTIINAGGGRGGGGVLAAVLLVAVLLVALFIIFGDRLTGSGATDIDIDVKAPDIELPKVDPPAQPAPSK
jgi:hypothetical protein